MSPDTGTLIVWAVAIFAIITLLEKGEMHYAKNEPENLRAFRMGAYFMALLVVAGLWFGGGAELLGAGMADFLRAPMGFKN